MAELSLLGPSPTPNLTRRIGLKVQLLFSCTPGHPALSHALQARLDLCGHHVGDQIHQAGLPALQSVLHCTCARVVWSHLVLRLLTVNCALLL